jgi:6-pyruvoyltetrahydropterin/6-carboxytetrahydropterin synthase
MSFQVSLKKETLIFSAAHFITFADQNGKLICERLHGHNYRVSATVDGSLDAHGCVIDFIWLRDTLKSITAELDHQVLLATGHPTITVEESGEEIIARFESRRWVFPREDVRLMAIDNTTAERLAEYIGGRLIKAMKSSGMAVDSFTRVSVGVDENEGQWAWWHRDL